MFSSFTYMCIILIGLVSFSSEDCHETNRIGRMCANRNFKGSCNYFHDQYSQFLECYQLFNLNNYHFQNNRIQRYFIEIFDSHLDEIVDGSFQGFDNLQGLTIYDSNLHSLEPGIFNGLHLFNLNLSHNSIPTISKGVFNAMYALVSLDLSQNTIKLIDNQSFTGMNSLEELYLNDNSISDMPKLTNCKHLTTLDISNNGINKLDFLVECLSIKTLNIAGNDIEHFDSNSLNNGLSSLDISRNKINYIESDSLKNLFNLTQLNLGNNPLFNETSMPIDLFRNLAYLKILNLSCTSLEKLSIGSFSGLAVLEILDLSLNYLKYLPKGIFHDLTSLRRLYVNNNQLSHFEYDGFSTLAEINLDGNVWNCHTLSTLTKSLINVKIVRGTAYNTTNLFGIPCYEEIEDYPNLPQLNSSNFHSLDKEYLSSIISEALTGLGTLLKQTVSNRNDQVDSKLVDTFESLIDKTNADKRNYSETYWKTLEKYQISLQHTMDNIEEIIGKIGNTISLTPNKTSEDDIKQLMLNLQTAQIQKDLIQGNYSIEHWNKLYSSQKNIHESLMDIKNILSSSKTISQPLMGDAKYAKSTEQLKIQEDNSVGQGATIPFYCVFVVLSAIFILLLLKQVKKIKRSRSDRIECNSLSTLQV